MHTWEVHVDAGSDYIDFASNFHSRHLAFGSEHDEHTGHVFTAYSHHIDHLDDPVAISNRVYSLELLVNGARRMSIGGIERTMRIKFSGYQSLTGTAGRYEVAAIDETPFDSSMPPPVPHCVKVGRFTPEHYIDVAASDNPVRMLLFLAGLIYRATPQEVILTWSTLYKMFDSYRWMAKQIGESLSDFEDTVGEVNRFTAACNNASILGLEARHGLSTNVPPSNPMTDLDEAIELNLRIARKICERYINHLYS
ncbi:hypothetical protein [Xanthomonas tesorieronis]|uniref:hypothetical protein n=1 Tax=Xanthomonas tesorieronis TaxID=3160839 RepID=UPI003511F187